MVFETLDLKRFNVDIRETMLYQSNLDCVGQFNGSKATSKTYVLL